MASTRLVCLVALIGLLAAAAGCDDNASSGNDGGMDAANDGGDDDAGDQLDGSDDASAPIKTTGEKLASALCNAGRDCPGVGTDLAMIAKSFGTDCEEALLDEDKDVEIDEFGSVARVVSKVQAGIAAGDITLDATLFESCLEGIEACAGTTVLYETCLYAFDGQVANEGDCASDFDCESNICVQLSDACGGTCADAEPKDENFTFEVVGADDPCGWDYDMEAGTVIHLVCPNDSTCQNVETVDDDFLGSCETPLAAGEACDSGQCAAGLVCFNGKCYALGVGDLGDDCNYAAHSENSDPEGDDLDFCNPWLGLDCVEGSCAVWSDGSENGDCTVNYPTCDGDLHCSDEGHCEQPGAVTAPCHRSNECLSGICNFDTSECITACI